LFWACLRWAFPPGRPASGDQPPRPTTPFVARMAQPSDPSPATEGSSKQAQPRATRTQRVLRGGPDGLPSAPIRAAYAAVQKGPGTLSTPTRLRSRRVRLGLRCARCDEPSGRGPQAMRLWRPTKRGGNLTVTAPFGMIIRPGDWTAIPPAASRPRPCHVDPGTSGPAAAPAGPLPRQPG